MYIFARFSSGFIHILCSRDFYTHMLTLAVQALKLLEPFKEYLCCLLWADWSYLSLCFSMENKKVQDWAKALSTFYELRHRAVVNAVLWVWVGLLLFLFFSLPQSREEAIICKGKLFQNICYILCSMWHSAQGEALLEGCWICKVQPPPLQKHMKNGGRTHLNTFSYT